MKTFATCGRFYRIGQPLVVALIAASIIALTALTGIQRGMDHAVTYGPEDEQLFISIAISESTYGLNLGHVAFRSVYAKLVKIWSRGTKNDDDPLLIANCSNANLLNEALRAAASLGEQKIGYLSDWSLVVPPDEDLGDADFFKLAFRLFGLQIQSYYYLFFSLLALSSLIFIITFRDNIYALLTLLCILFAFYIELHINLFSAYMPTFPGQRHGSTLALISLWYFIFLLNRRPSSVAIGGALAQAAILILAWRIRGSVSWILIFLLALAIALAVQHWLRRPRESRSWLDLVSHARRWPIYILIFGAAANFFYNRIELHPIYFTDDVMPYHGAWHFWIRPPV